MCVERACAKFMGYLGIYSYENQTVNTHGMLADHSVLYVKPKAYSVENALENNSFFCGKPTKELPKPGSLEFRCCARNRRSEPYDEQTLDDDRVLDFTWEGKHPQSCSDVEAVELSKLDHIELCTQKFDYRTVNYRVQPLHLGLVVAAIACVANFIFKPFG